MMKHCLLTLALLAMVATVGCEPGKPMPAPVSGKVLINGQPAANITIIFMDETDRTKNATGKSGADGSYQLTTSKVNDGARPGDYKVVFMDAELQDTPTATTTASTKGPDLKSADYMKQMEKVAKANQNPADAVAEEAKKGRVPQKYQDPKSTPFNKKVEKGKNEFDFDITGA